MTNSHRVLARKWRPQNFHEVVGQEHVLRAISNGILQGRLHHAYLLTGTRGVGKTTIARIIAKCLNCEIGTTATPCEQCDNCQAINNQCFIDLIEIDAASKTKVEDTRELLDNIAFAPTMGRYKVYLIDEVHMLSGHSFNALLKTLEEPPAHVVFILATTDPQKIPATILSRCLQFHLKNLSITQIEQQLTKILQTEQITFDSSALTLIATQAHGSLRDALSLLDQAIAYCGEKITETDVAALIGTVDRSQVFKLIYALNDEYPENLLNLSTELATLGIDYYLVLDEMANQLHQIAICQSTQNLSDNSEIKKLAELFSPEDIQLFYQIVINGKRDIHLAPNEKIGFEMILLRLHAFKIILPNPKSQESELKKKPELKSANIPVEKLNPATMNSRQLPLTNYDGDSQGEKYSSSLESQVHGENNQSTSQREQLINSQKPDWSAIISQLQLTGLARTLAEHSTLAETTDKEWRLHLDNQQSILLTPEIKDSITFALQRYLGKPLQLNIIVEKTKGELSPARIVQQQAQEKQQKANDVVYQDPKVQSWLNAFDGKIIRESISAPQQKNNDENDLINATNNEEI